MIRKMLGLAWEAAKVELEHLGTPAPALVEPAVEIVPVINEVTEVTAAPTVTKVPTTNKWHSSEYHVKALNSPTCLECGESKRVGSYKCTACTSEVSHVV